MSLARYRNCITAKFKTTAKSFATAALDNEEYTATPQYPPILDLSPDKVRERRKEALHESIKNIKTVEEKQIKLNMPRYYGFKCYMFDDSKVPYNQLPLIQHLTRTHLIVKDQLPEFYNKITVDELLKNIKDDIEETLLVEYKHYRRKHDIVNEEITEAERDHRFSRWISCNIHRILINNVSRTYPHLLDTQLDFDPRIESSWFAGGMEPPVRIKRSRRDLEWSKHRENEPTDRAIQYLCSPFVSLRAKLPILPIIPYSEVISKDYAVPYFKYDPRVVGTTTVHRHVTNIPGYWPGDSHEFGILSYISRRSLIDRDFNDPEEHKEAVHRIGILHSFAWLNAQANHLGFTTFNDITYPLITQTLITNGQIWSFYTYQLNTLLVHSKYVDENPTTNICWATNELKLFDEIQDGKIVGFNDDVLKMLVQYYANAPEERLGINMKPYLDQQLKYSANYEDDDKRQWLEREYKFLMSNRGRHKLPYELYHWEKIYKVDHETRPMEPRRRPFELGQKPWMRTLDARQAFYIPKALRPHLPKQKGRYAKEYFP